MKKAIYAFTVISLAMLSVAPAVAADTQICPDGICESGPETNTETVGTGFQRSEAGGAAPIIKAKWEMLPEGMWNEECDDCDVPTGTLKADDSCAPGAQFWPTGQWDAFKEIVVCAIATDPDGVSDINAVYADIFYPEAINLGPEHWNEGDIGCGEQHGYEIKLTELTKADGYELFCNKIQGWNYNLPVFNPAYDYAEICAADGELMKETARVYCKHTFLSWEDPAGMYKTVVHAADMAGLDSEPLINYFEYLPLTAFEVDFASVDYGNVKLNTHKIINGNLTWGDNIPSVRNVGNTRLRMTIIQDDMCLGKTVNGDEWWNVQWDARVGSNAAFSVYDPQFYCGDYDPYGLYEATVLDKHLELSEMNEMDFSILVSKFPLGTGIEGYYSGQMILGAIFEPFMGCTN